MLRVLAKQRHQNVFSLKYFCTSSQDENQIFSRLPLIYSMVYIAFIFNCTGVGGMGTTMEQYKGQPAEVLVQLRKLLLERLVLWLCRLCWDEVSLALDGPMPLCSQFSPFVQAKEGTTVCICVYVHDLCHQEWTRN